MCTFVFDKEPLNLRYQHPFSLYKISVLNIQKMTATDCRTIYARKVPRSTTQKVHSPRPVPGDVFFCCFETCTSILDSESFLIRHRRPIFTVYTVNFTRKRKMPHIVAQFTHAKSIRTQNKRCEALHSPRETRSFLDLGWHICFW